MTTHTDEAGAGFRTVIGCNDAVARSTLGATALARRDLPIAGLKLDRSFTFGVADGDRRCIELSKALVGLADGLGLDGVAEGVETEPVARALAAHGWRHGQGWLFGRPSPAPTG